MNVFAILTDPDNAIELTEKNYNRFTKRDFPYVQHNANNEPSAYAICPECQNPIRLINRNVDSTESKTFYARHHCFSVPHLANYDQDAYEDCQLANPHRFDGKVRRKPGQKTDHIKQVFLNNIDLIITTLEQEMGIKLSDSTIENMIADFCKTKGYEYRAVGIHNLPLAFAYMTEAQNLLGCVIKGNIAEAINQQSHYFEAIKGRYGIDSYLLHRKPKTSRSSLKFFFSEHSIPKGNNQNNESVQMHIIEIESNQLPENAPIIFSRQIKIDATKFQNTIKRREKLRSIIRRYLDR
ncbi:hypothetical protein [Providencia stuartii]|uniref:hypothetical protein n=1 Tax=Providencia stuartii TaxID=588 RepID=UPI00111C94F6|nr:hypothetical protein [Providencia stuartii]